jgi:hypothetical protein
MAVKMDLKTAIEVLRKHQSWRNGWDVAPIKPTQLTWSIELVLDAAQKHAKTLDHLIDKPAEKL